MQPISLAAKAVETPEILATLSESELRLVMAACIETAAAAYKQWVGGAAADQIAKLERNGDRLLGTKEICKRIGCSMSTLMVGWKAGRYPFMLKDGGRLVGSEDGLERWIRNRIKHQSLR
jgi:predicted DNA-binding transcriptional regulator AlpA